MARRLQTRLAMNTTKSLGVLSLSVSFIVGCASSTEEPREAKQDVATPAVEQTLTPKEEYLGEWGPYDDDGETETRCYQQYSDVVAVYIGYAPWHCEGWTGKVFCEYESLSSVYGPGWGQCQCYNEICSAYAKRGRSCRYRRCY